MTPDIHTLLLILILASLLQAAALVIQKVLIKTYKGINWWMWGYLAITAGFILFQLQASNSIQPFLGFIANLLFVTGLASLYIGTLRFLGRKENRVLVISVLAVFIVVYLYFTYISYNISILMAASAIALAIIAFSTAWQLFTHKPRYISASANLVCGIFTFGGLFFTYRSVAVFFADPITSLFDPTALQTLTILVPFVTGIPLTFSLIIMINQRLNGEMQQAKTYFETIFNTSPDRAVISRLDDGTFFDVNKAHCEFSGHTRKDLIGKSSLASSIWKYPEERLELARVLKKKAAVDNFEATFIHKDGSLLYGLISARIIDINGVPHILSITRDISDRKKAEEALKESETFNMSLLRDAPNPIVVYNLDGSIRYMNTALENLTGYSLKEILGHHFSPPWWPEDKIEQYDLQNRQNFQGTIGQERLYKKKNGELFWVSLSLRQIGEPGQPKYILINWVDITELKKLEAEIQALYEKEKLQRQALEEEAKLRLRFIDILAHELKAPLTPIMASSGMLQEILSKESDSPQKKLSENIYRSTNVLFRRLEELLDAARFSRGDISLHLEQTETTEYLKSVVSRYQPSLDQRNQTLLLELPDVLPSVTFDRSRIEQVIVNLLSNASKYSPTDSSIVFHARTENEGLLIEVKDQGIGISLEDQSRLFQPYQRVGQNIQKIKGLGLGLTIVKQIVEKHGGQIRVTSELDKGSTFSFWIPFSTPSV